MHDTSGFGVLCAMAEVGRGVIMVPWGATFILLRRAAAAAAMCTGLCERVDSTVGRLEVEHSPAGLDSQ